MRRVRIRARLIGPPITIERGMRVFDLGATSRYGVVVQSGREVSEVQWFTGARQYVTNEYLRMAPSRIREKMRW